MRRLQTSLLILVAAAASSCGGKVDDGGGTLVETTSSGLTRHLYIFDQSGTQTGAVQGFFQCLLGHTDWNSQANTYSAGETLQWGGIKFVGGNPCGQWDAQCWTNHAGWNVTDYDVLLTILPTGKIGGQNDVCRVNGHTVNCAFIGDGGGVEKWQTVYADHEVFEAATDGVSGDCCDGETSSGGPFPWCAECGAYPGRCGQYAANGTLGISTLACPDGRTYYYQKMSPGNHEFDGTCLSLNIQTVCKGPPPTPAAPSGCGTIKPGQGLKAGQSFKSCSGNFELSMQTDGNLVLYVGTHATWASGTNGSGKVAIMQTDGNLVVYDGCANPVWSNARNGHNGANLAVQDDGNLVEYQNGGVIWASNTQMQAPGGPSGCGTLSPGQGLMPGKSLASCDGAQHMLVMQNDGNLVLYHSGKAIWSTNTANSAAYLATMQTDGNFVLYDIHDNALWSSATDGNAGARLVLQNDGNLVVYQGSAALWASGTNGR